MNQLPDTTILTAHEMGEPMTLDLGGAGRVAVFSARAPGKDRSNEDAAAIIPVDEHRTVLAIADGMGGHEGGAEAAGLAVNALVESLREAAAVDGDLRTAILNGIEWANGRISSLGVDAGTTLAVAEIDGRILRPYHVGDSVILAFGQRGHVRLETVAHSPVGYAVESGMLDAADAIHHEHRHLVSNYVGAPDMHIEIGPPIRLLVRDTIVLGTDGLFDNLHVEEIIEIARKGRLDRAAATLARLSHERMLEPEPGHPSKPDDRTFIVYRPQPRRS
jgi:serine/threonine protein phosphatase PrpC